MKLDRVIAVRNNKTIYRDGDRAIKVFGADYSKADVLNEALNQARIEETGLNIPKVLEVTMIDGKWAIVSEFIKGNSDAEKLEGLIKAINDLKARVGIKETIKDYGIDEADFLARLDDMVEQAFDDQCTGANPRYPLMSEIKQMYLNAYYGKHFVEEAMPLSNLDEAKVDPIKTPYRKGKKA